MRSLALALALPISLVAVLSACSSLAGCGHSGAPSPAAPPVVVAAPVVSPQPVSGDGSEGIQGGPCGEGEKCAPGLACRTYYGVAGPQGPKFSSCEIACIPGKSKCPSGQACMTIADGPGSVCRFQDRVLPPPVPRAPSDR